MSALKKTPARTVERYMWAQPTYTVPPLAAALRFEVSSYIQYLISEFGELLEQISLLIAEALR
jgi:hypothetical protein